MIIDTHGHYDDERFQEDREALLRGMRDNNIEFIINSGADFQGCKDTLQMTKEFSFVYGTLGIHPMDSHKITEEVFHWLENNIKEDKIVAVGEIGLDYYYEETNRELQRKWFRKQLDLAKRCEMPVVIHSRDAAEDTVTILTEAEGGKYGGSLHCFSYSKEIALQFVKLGFHIGVGGIITFKNARKLKETVEVVPLEHILLETDCPYLSPEPFRGERNDSSRLIYVAEEIAKIKGISVEEVIRITSENAKDLFRLPR